MLSNWSGWSRKLLYGSGIALVAYIIILITKWAGVWPTVSGMDASIRGSSEAGLQKKGRSRPPTRYYIRVVSKTDPSLFYLEKLRSVKCLFEPVIKVNDTELKISDFGIHMAVFLEGKKVVTRCYSTHNKSEDSILFFNALSDIVKKGSANDLLIIQTFNGVGDVRGVATKLKELGVTERMPYGAGKNDRVLPYVLVYDLKHGKVIYEACSDDSICVIYEDKVNI